MNKYQQFVNNINASLEEGHKSIFINNANKNIFSNATGSGNGKKNLTVLDEHLLASIIGQTDDSVLITDSNGIIKYVNPAFEIITGYTSDEVVGRKPNILKSGQHDKAFYQKLWKTILDGKSFKEIFINRRKDGDIFYEQKTITPLIDKNGSITHFVSTAKDITAQKHAEEALLYSEHRLRTIIDNEPECVKIVSRNGRLLDMNPAGLEMVEADEISKVFGQPVINLVHPEDHTIYKNLHQQACQGVACKGEFRMIGLRETVRWVEIHATPLRDTDGKITSVLSVARDVTDRKKSGEQLALLDFAINHAHEAVYLMDKHARFLYVNNEACQKLGYSRDELLGQQVTYIDPMFTMEQWYQYWDKLETEGSASLESIHQHKDGSRFPVEINTNYFEFNNQGYDLALVRDISERKKAEKELKESEIKLKEAQRMANMGYWYWNIKTGEVNWSDEVYSIFQLDPDEFIPQIDSIMALSPWPEDNQRHKELLEKAIQSHEQGEFEQRFLRPDNSIGYYYSTFKGIYDDNDNVIAIKGTVQDITEKKQAEKELREREKHLSLVTENFPGMVSRVDCNQKYLFANKDYERWFGKPAADIIGRTVAEVMPVDVYKTAEPYILRALAGERVSYENTVHTLSGNTLYAFVTLVPDIDVDGDVNGFFTIVLDITERKLAEQGLLQETERLEQAEKNAQLGCWEVVGNTGEIWWSKTMYELFGFDNTEWVPEIDEILKHIHPDDRQDVNNMYSSMVHGKEPTARDFRSNPELGPIKYLRTTVDYSKSDHDQTIKYTGTVLDITRAKEAENALRASEAQLSNAMKMARAGHWEYDVSKNLFTFNDHFYAIFKTNAEKVGSYTMSPDEYARRFVHPDDLLTVTEEVQAAIKSTDPDHSRELEHRIIYADGSIGHIAVRIYIVKDKQGRTVKTYGVNQDITKRKMDEAALLENDLRFKYVAKATSDAIWDWDLNSNSLWWNEGMYTLFGYFIDEIESDISSWTNHIHPEDKKRVIDGIHKIINSSDDYWHDEYRYIRKDNSYAYVLDRGYVIRDEQGKGIRMVGGMTDLTERKEAQDKILRLNRVYKMLSGINSLIVHVHNKQELFNEACRIAVEEGEFTMACITSFNTNKKNISVEAIAGHEDGYLDCVQSSLRDDPDYTEKYGPLLEVLFQNEPLILNNLANDLHHMSWKDEALSRGYQSCATLPLFIENEILGIISLYSNETHFFNEEEMKLLTEFSGDISYALRNLAKEEKIEYLASYDHLTGLANRTLFHDHLNSVLRRAEKARRKIALLVCDLKQFRNINNVYGRDVGDEVLKVTARRLRELTTDPVNIGRISSDYFAMILHDVRDSTGIGYMFENALFPALNKPITVNNNEIQVNFSGGIAVYPLDGSDADTLYRNAEAALKKAKVSGDQYLFYQPEMTTRIAENLRLEARLKKALDENQFILHYQPKIDSINRKIVGLEALIRWNDPESGLVPPGKFIPLLEETGLIIDVGLWALDQAATDYRKWENKFKPVPRISVNVSPVQLKQKRFVHDVENVIKLHGKPVPLDLEITESLIMTDIEQNITKLKAIRMAGLGIDIDDFGTGYSSLSYIARLPVDSLKIDRSFITNMTKQSESMTIVSTIINLAQSLNLKVIAEGVETEEQAKFLTLLKCNQMQGFLFSKPVPADALEELLAKDNEADPDKILL